MAKHWKAFFIGWAVCWAIVWVFPVTNYGGYRQFVGAVGATLPFMVFPLLGAGIGRLAGSRTATGMSVGGVLAGLLMVPYLVSALS